MSKLLLSELTSKALRAYYNVYNAHSHDYPESFFEQMLLLELRSMCISAKSQVPYEIRYKGVRVGRHITDVELEDSVVLELKALPHLLSRNDAQLISNLKISGKQVGLLLNFGGDKPEIRRKVFTGIVDYVPIVWHLENPDRNLIEPAITYLLRQRQYDLKLGMIVNFQNEKLEVKYVK